jgi:hypothetical protein
MKMIDMDKIHNIVYEVLLYTDIEVVGVHYLMYDFKVVLLSL